MRLDISSLQLSQVDTDGVRASGEGRASLRGDSLVLLVGLVLELVVLLDSLEELVAAGGLSEVLRADMESLFDLPVPDDLVDDDADGSGVDVEDLGGSAVVDVVGHALVDGSVDLDVDELAALELGEVVGHLDRAVLPERLGEL